MSDEITIGGQEYVSSKRASELSDYAQDYIGQLARSGLVDAHRIGGLWYVSMDSLGRYKKKSESTLPSQPVFSPASEADTLISFEGKDYISATRASKLTGYNQDYVGQLARSGVILSRQIGNRWYVDREALVAHKREKDALLAAVQAESVGLPKNDPRAVALENLSYAGPGPFLTYTSDEKDLMPMLKKANNDPLERSIRDEAVHRVPIRIRESQEVAPRGRDVGAASSRGSRASGKTIFYGSLSAAALTIVIVLTFGFSSVKDRSVYALRSVGETASAAASSLGLSAPLKRIGDALEEWIAPEMIYERSF